MNRRAFLQAAGAAALSVPALQSQTPAGQTTAANIRLGVATYSLRQFQRDLAIRSIALMGIHCADVKDFHMPVNDTARESAEAHKKFEAAGIQIVAGGNISLTEDDEMGLRRHFDYARNCGFPIMVCAPKHSNLALIEKLAIEYNVRMAIHNHGPEFPEFPGPRAAFEAVRNMDPRMGLCIDIGHTSRAGEDIVESIAMAGPRLFEMHFKDLRDARVKESQCIVGQGVLPIPAIFRALNKISYRGTCSLEYEIDEDNPVPGMQQSFAYMRGVIAGENL